jgi:hypothetical protein
MLQDIVNEVLAQGVWIARHRCLHGQELVETRSSIRLAGCESTCDMAAPHSRGGNDCANDVPLTNIPVCGFGGPKVH